MRILYLGLVVFGILGCATYTYEDAVTASDREAEQRWENLKLQAVDGVQGEPSNYIQVIRDATAVDREVTYMWSITTANDRSSEVIDEASRFAAVNNLRPSPAELGMVEAARLGAADFVIHVDVIVAFPPSTYPIVLVEEQYVYRLENVQRGIYVSTDMLRLDRALNQRRREERGVVTAAQWE